jgi:hypothetical protein
MKIKIILLVLAALLLVTLTSCYRERDSGESPDRGIYIYDEIGRLPLESKLALSSYLWKLDNRTDYEIVMVFPKEKLDETAIIAKFNEMAVGKKGKDTGAAIFVFPDNSVFVAIGSGNDRVSVTFSKTYGERILKDLDKEPVLSLLRFAGAIGGKINEPITTSKLAKFGENVKENVHIILLWALVLSLIVFLLQQINGFQKSDLIIPIILLVFAGIFVGASMGGSEEKYLSTEYGIITATKHDTRDWIEMRVICTSTGKSTVCVTVPVPHTDYINYVTIKSYDLKDYGYKFVTTDNKGAWTRIQGEVDALTINQKDGVLYGVYTFNDKSGGKTIGDGVWILAGKNK